MQDEKEIKKIIDQSGNSFHIQVINFLKNKGWHTLISPYYMDLGTNKAREIDLLAENHWVHKGDYSGGKYGFLIFKLFIECKYISQPTVFWFSNRDITSAKKWVVANTCLPENNTFTDQHHYLSPNLNVAKLFASKGKQGMESEAIYKALNQTLNAMVYLRGHESINPEFPKQHKPILSTVEMPVIVCNSFDDFYRVEMDKPDEVRPIDGNFQLEVNYAYINNLNNRKSEYFLIDIIDFNKLLTSA